MTAARKFGQWVKSYRNGYGKRPGAGESGPIVLRIADVSSGRVDLSNPRRGTVDDKEADTYRLRTGDLLFVRVNGAREIVGRCCVIGPEVPSDTIFNDHLIRVRLAPGVDADFARLCVSLPRARAIIQEAASTSAGQLTISQQVLDSIDVPDVELDEQRKLVARLYSQLSEVEAAQFAARAQSRDVSLLRARLLTEVFSSLNDLPRKSLGDHAPTTSGTTPSRGDQRYWDPAEIPWVKTGEVAFAPITRTEEAISKIALAECSLALLPPKTVLVAMYGQGKTRGQSAILEVAAATNQACFAILPNDTWEPEFLHHWLMASYSAMRSLSDDRGGNQANLNGALLKALKIPAPDKPAQQAIVRRAKAALAEVDAMAAANKVTLADLDRLPQQLLALAFGDAK
jgi:type I restriction enzyme S subunit